MTTHVCPGCRRVQVARSKLSCKTCWYRLPIELRRALLATPGDIDLVMACVEWYSENPG